MKLKQWTELERGKQAWLAREIGVSLPTMTRWVNGLDEIPENRTRQIEQATGGVVTCEEMRPDLTAEFEYMRTRPVAGLAEEIQGD
jgi:DNA-binding transcriptional regulator YdaS (Cro superfamily)